MADELQQIAHLSSGQIYLERGDAPAQSVLHENAKAKSLRQAGETQEELWKIQTRVQNTLGSYELSEAMVKTLGSAVVQKIKDNFLNHTEPELELVDDLSQLMIILSDPVAKKKYQQHVTVFIVGYEQISRDRSKLLQQVNQFFARIVEEEEDEDSDNDQDAYIVDMATNVRSIIDKAEDMQKRLASASNGILSVLEYSASKDGKSKKKKFDKALQQSKDDLMVASEKLLQLQNDLTTSEEKFTQLKKSNENKQIEIEKLKYQINNNKKKIADTEEIRTNLTEKDDALATARQEINRLKLVIAGHEEKEGNIIEKSIQTREAKEDLESRHEDRISDMQINIIEIRQALEKQYEEQVETLCNSHHAKMSELQQRHSEQIEISKLEIEDLSKQNEILTEDKMRALTRAASYMTGLTEDSSSVKQSTAKDAWKASARASRKLVQKEKSAVSFDSVLDSENATPWPTDLLSQDNSLLSFPSLTIPSFPSTPGKETNDIAPISNNSILILECNSKAMQVTEADLQPIQPINKANHKFCQTKEEWRTQLQNAKTQTDEIKIQVKAVGTQTENEVSSDEQITDNQDIKETVAKEVAVETDFLVKQLTNLKNNYDSKVEALRDIVAYKESWDVEREELMKKISILGEKKQDCSNDPNNKTKLLEEKTDPLIITQSGTHVSFDDRQSQSKLKMDVVSSENGNHRIYNQLSECQQSLLKLKSDLFFQDESSNPVRSVSSSNGDDYFSSPGHNNLNDNIMSLSTDISQISVVLKNFVEDSKLENADAQACDGDQNNELFNKNTQTSYVTLDTEPSINPKYVVSTGTTSVKSLDHSGEQKRQQQRLISDYKSLISKHKKLREQMNLMQSNVTTTNQQHDEQLLANAKLIDDMQTIISNLNKQLDSVHRHLSSSNEGSEQQQEIASVPSFMFTSRDMMRNAKTLQQATQLGCMPHETLNTVCKQMKDYVSLPLKRFAALICRYQNYCAMRNVESKLQHHKNQDFESMVLLGKMEILQKKRTRKWLERMATASELRFELATNLVNTLEKVEQETGRFLIKPLVYVNGQRTYSRENCRTPTPSMTEMPWQQTTAEALPHRHSNRAEPLLNIAHFKKPTKENPSGLWQVTHSSDDHGASAASPSIVTPHMVEIDVKRLKGFSSFDQLPPIGSSLPQFHSTTVFR